MVERSHLQIGMHAGCGGGVDRYFDGLCRAFERSGVSYRGVVFGRGVADEAADLPAGTTILGSAEAPLHERWQLIRKAVSASGLQPSKALIASHFALYGWPVLSLRHRGVRLVSHFHGPWADESAAEGASRIAVLAKRLLERRVYHGSAKVISVSEAFRRLAISRYGLRPDRVAAVPAGIDAEAIGKRTAGVSRREARERLGWPPEPDRRIVFCVRRITRRMGLENLIDAVSALAGRHPELLVMIGGRGAILDELRARVARLGLENHVRLLGFVPDAELPLAYRAADFTVVPSVALEGFGLVILESWAAGTPVLVTPVGGMPEVVSPFAPECVLGGSSVAALVQGIGAVMAGDLVLPGAAGCEDHVRRAHAWETVARRLLLAYG